MRSERCEICKYWKKREDESDDLWDGLILGYCRINPPVYATNYYGFGQFPQVFSHDWCGKWELKTPHDQERRE